MASGINETKPAESSGLVSAEIRDNFAAAKNEIEDLQNNKLDSADLSTTASASNVVIGNTGGNDATLTAATPVQAGVMTGTDKSQLNSHESRLDQHDTDIGNKISGVDIGTVVRTATAATIVNSEGANAVLSAANVTEAGLMTAADKVQLNDHESRLDQIDTDQGTQNGRLDQIDTDQGTQNGRLDQIDIDLGGKISGVNLAATRNATQVNVTNTEGDDAALLGASETEAGVMVAADKAKLNRYPGLVDPAVGANDGKKYRLEIAGGAFVAKELFDQDEQRTDALIHQTVTPFVYSTMTAALTQAGDYIFNLDAEVSYNNGQSKLELIVYLDGNPIITHRKEPKDAGGAGTVEATSTGGTANTGTDTRWEVNREIKIPNMTVGSHTLEIQYRGTVANNEPTIYNSYMRLRTK